MSLYFKNVVCVGVTEWFPRDTGHGNTTNKLSLYIYQGCGADNSDLTSTTSNLPLTFRKRIKIYISNWFTIGIVNIKAPYTLQSTCIILFERSNDLA
jgi:hypothetical protein